MNVGELVINERTNNSITAFEPIALAMLKDSYETVALVKYIEMYTFHKIYLKDDIIFIGCNSYTKTIIDEELFDIELYNEKYPNYSIEKISYLIRA